MQLDDLGFVGRGKSKHRPRNDPSLYGGDYPFIQTGDVKEADLWLTHYTQTYNEVGLAQSKLWPAGTLCITIAANIAETAILRIPACFPDSIVGFIPHPRKADARFIKYYIDTIKLRMQNASKGTTQDNLSLDKLLSFNFEVPDWQTQERVASILSGYDDLIENNACRIKVLEEMAQIIYREWFVNFRFPEHHRFRMMESELGPIPEGFRVDQLGNVIAFENGKSTDNGNEGLFPLYGSNGVIGRSKIAKYRDAVILGRVGAYCGSTMYCGDGFWASDNTIVATPAAGKDLCIEFVYFLLQNMNLRRYAGGSAQPLLTQGLLRQLRCVIPSRTTNAQFRKICKPLLGLVFNLRIQTHNLRTTRDLLLPKLISGAISLEAAEKEAVAQGA